MSPLALLYYYIGFPGLGIKDFHVDSVALEIGDLEIRWYGVIIVCGIVAAFVYTYLHAKRHGLILDDLIDLTLSAVIPGVIGARAYYVFFDYLKNPQNYSEFIDFIAVWNGGLAIYGGLIFGVIGVVIALKIKKMRVLTLLDSGFPGVLLAQAIGRWGNFFNMEAYGAETNWFCRMKLSYESGTAIYVHPTFLYESLWNLLGCIILSLLFKKRKFDGQIFLMAVSWYGFGRMFIEGLRQDSLYIGDFRVSQVLAFLLFVASLILIIVMLIKNRERHVARCIYTAKSAKYTVYEVEDGKDPDYDYDMNMLYAKKTDKAEEHAEAQTSTEDDSADEATSEEASEELTQSDTDDSSNEAEEDTNTKENVENEEKKDASEENSSEISSDESNE
ncbi:MAG: prolipoprotein diacylglyceryl transferase [Clostridia bacterium]|nr:prolipoprotein diacylglyceryl transferase [Clostridia bacterium]